MFIADLERTQRSEKGAAKSVDDRLFILRLERTRKNFKRHNLTTSHGQSDGKQNSVEISTKYCAMEGKKRNYLYESQHSKKVYQLRRKSEVMLSCGQIK